MKTKRYFSFIGEVWCKSIEGPNTSKLGVVLHRASTGATDWDVVIYAHTDNDELVFVEEKHFHEERNWFFGNELSHTDDAYWESKWYIAHVSDFLFNPEVPVSSFSEEIRDALTNEKLILSPPGSDFD